MLQINKRIIVVIFQKDFKFDISKNASTRKDERTLLTKKRQFTEKFHLLTSLISKYYFHCVIIRVFALFQNTFLLRVFERIMFLSHNVAWKKTRSYFLPKIDDIN